MFGSASQPVGLGGRELAVFAHPMAAFLGRRRVDHASNVARGAHDKALLARQVLGGGVGAANRHDVVFTRAIDVDRQVKLAQVDFLAADGDLARLAQLVFQVGVAQVPGVKRPGQVGGVAVPVQQVKRRRRFALEVIADHVVPDQVVRAQKAEGGRQILPLEQTALAHLLFAVLNKGLVNEHVQDAGVGEIQQGREKGGTGHRLFAARGEHRQRRAEDGATHAKAQRIDGLGACDLLRHRDGLDGGVFDVVIPGLLGQAGIGVAPADDKGAVALRHGVADQRVFGLQVQDVELVDAGRHQQKRLLEHLGGERLVFDQLEQLVLEHHRAFGGGHVFANFKQALVRHGHMALLQVMQHVLQALGDALALGVDGFLLRVGIEGQKIAGCAGRHPLLHGKADAGAGFGITLHGIGQAHQGAGIEQVG